MSTSKKLAVPVIEDDDKHFGSMEKTLKERYELTRFRAMDDRELYNYKALNPESQIVVVDLRLGTDSEGPIEEGYKIIERVLWPADRTTYFVIFSEHVGPGRIPDAFRVNPHWTFVRKELSEGRLTEQCLNNLSVIMDAFAQYTSPLLETPFYDSFPLIQEVNEYCAAAGLEKGLTSHLDLFRKSLAESTNRLNEMARAAASYAKAGRDTDHLALAVYGSCGRLEMRPESDVEFSFYWDRTAGLECGALAVRLWNRMAAHFHQRKWRFEGEEKLGEYPKMLLPVERADQPLVNQFFPVIPKQALFETPERATLRTRAYQILTELRPAFNPAFFYQLAREVMTKKMSNSPLVGDVVTSQFFHDMTAQFLMDTALNDKLDWKGVKRYCFRVMNTCALRLALIQFNRQKHQLNSESEWAEFLNILRDPPIVKLARFGKLLFDDDLHNSLKFENLFASYVHVLADFYVLSGKAAQEGEVTQTESFEQMRPRLVHLLKRFCELFESSKLQSPGVLDSWLNHTDDIRHALRTLGGG